MSGFDSQGIFFSDNFGSEDPQGDGVNRAAVQRRFKDFLRKYHDANFTYKYRYGFERRVFYLCIDFVLC